VVRLGRESMWAEAGAGGPVVAAGIVVPSAATAARRNSSLPWWGSEIPVLQDGRGLLYAVGRAAAGGANVTVVRLPADAVHAVSPGAASICFDPSQVIGRLGDLGVFEGVSVHSLQRTGGDP
jgi:hypothetical protein